MKKTIAIALFILVLSFGCKKEGGGIVGEQAPDFTLNEISGRPVSLASYKGKVVLLEFWATWCPPCQAATPDLINLYAKYNHRGFELIAVSLDDDINTVKAFAVEKGMNYHVLHDDRGVADLYRVRSIPVSFLIDKNGKIISKHNGYSPEMVEELSKSIESLL